MKSLKLIHLIGILATATLALGIYTLINILREGGTLLEKFILSIMIISSILVIYISIKFLNKNGTSNKMDSET